MELDIITATETARLAELETTIEHGLRTFVDVGNALLEIRDGRLYRGEWGTFEEYCLQRWSLKRFRAYELMEAATVVHNVGNFLQMPPPERESHAAPLSSLEPDEQREVWQRAVETAPEGKVTGAHVQNVVDEYKGGASQPVEVTMFSHKSIEYYTPSQYVEAARDVMGGIDLDPASCEVAQETIRATRFYTQEQDGYLLPWAGRLWLNPPYSYREGQSNQEAWSQRLVAEYLQGNVTEAVLLVKAALGYNWFEALWYDWPVCFSRERLAFIREDGNDDGQSKQASAFFYFGPDVAKFRAVFRQFGRVIMPEVE